MNASFNRTTADGYALSLNEHQEIADRRGSLVRGALSIEKTLWVLDDACLYDIAEIPNLIRSAKRASSRVTMRRLANGLPAREPKLPKPGAPWLQSLNGTICYCALNAWGEVVSVGRKS